MTTMQFTNGSKLLPLHPQFYLRWFGNQSSLYSMSIYTLCTEHKHLRGEHFLSRYTLIARGDRTDAIALLQLYKNDNFWVYFVFFWKNENRDLPIFYVNMKVPS